MNLGFSQTLQNHSWRTPKSSRAASSTAFLVAIALKSTLVEVQNKFKAPRSPTGHPKSQVEAQWRPILPQHGANFKSQTFPNEVKSTPKSAQASVPRRRLEKKLMFHKIMQ